MVFLIAAGCGVKRDGLGDGDSGGTDGGAGTGGGGAPGTAGTSGGGTAGTGGDGTPGTGGTGVGGDVTGGAGTGPGSGGAGTSGAAGTGPGGTGTGGTDGPPVVQRFPLRLSADGRTMLDLNGVPFLFQGDAAWGLIAAAGREMADEYLEDRRQKGFNAALVRLMEHHFAVNPPLNVYGQGPFTTPGDFSTPNEAYFAHVDWVIRRANEKGILMLLFPAYLGYAGQDEGWYEEMAANGPAKLREFGRYLGNRYKGHPNILWVDAGNYGPPSPDLVRAVALGILDNDPIHLHTAHCGRTTSALDCFPNETWLHVNATYSSHNSYAPSLKDHGRTPFKPFLLLDSIYENENESTRASLRAQAYWAMLSGAQGQNSGNNPVWAFTGPPLYPPPHGWDTGLQDPTAFDMVRVTALFAPRPWFDLVPDKNHTTVIAGYGTYSDNSREMSSDYVTAARAGDGRLMIAYVPDTDPGTRTLTVDMTRLAGAADARWYNPTTGGFVPVSGSPFANVGTRVFTTPGDNGTGDNDWALVLEVP